MSYYKIIILKNSLNNILNFKMDNLNLRSVLKIKNSKFNASVGKKNLI